jgi:mannitol/fructose-specific phosphotransferase system IIA component (Ntr-type)
MINFFNDELVEIKACYRTKVEVITSIFNKFYSKGYVDQSFIEDVFKRESLGPTEVGNGVAIPHGFSEHVIQSKIGIVILDNPIEWAEEMVDVIFLIGISKADLSKAKGIFRKLYNKIDSVMFLENIRKANSAAEIKRLLEVK